MITGLWKNVRLVCGNPAHSTNEIMFLKQTPEDVFYACPKYDPENRSPDEKPCMNRISVNEAEKMLDVLAEKEFLECQMHLLYVRILLYGLGHHTCLGRCFLQACCVCLWHGWQSQCHEGCV